MIMWRTVAVRGSRGPGLPPIFNNPESPLMTVVRRRLSLTSSAADFLLEELEAVGRSSEHAHRRRLGRAAVTFRPCRQGRDAIPAGLIPFDAFRLLAVTYGYSDGRGPRPRVSLGVFRPTLDPTGSGRIRFRCEQRRGHPGGRG
jgi:hypothetical protein